VARFLLTLSGPAGIVPATGAIPQRDRAWKAHGRNQKHLIGLFTCLDEPDYIICDASGKRAWPPLFLDTPLHISRTFHPVRRTT
jgi:hypothetical protein